MARKIHIEFLNDERTRARVTMVQTPSWIARLFGARDMGGTMIARLDMSKPYIGDDWVYDVDGLKIADSQIEFALVQQRRWDPIRDVQLPQARTVTPNKRKAP